MRHNLEFCREAIFRQERFCRILQRTNTSKDNFMFQLENTTFDMVSSGISEGCLYGTVFSDGRYKYMRFFESGMYKGFFESKGKLTAHYSNMQFTAIFHGCKNANFQMKNYHSFLIFAQNIDFGYKLEPPH